MAHVGVGDLLPPALEAQVEHNEAKGQDDNDINCNEDSEAGGTGWGVKAPVHLFKHCRGGGEVARHNCREDEKGEKKIKLFKISH